MKRFAFVMLLLLGLALPAAAASGPLALTVTVAGRAGAPLAGARVELWHEGEAAPVATVTADADGAYQFDGLIPGDRYSVTVVAGEGNASSLAPGEPSITPLFRAVAGATRQFDLGF